MDIYTNLNSGKIFPIQRYTLHIVSKMPKLFLRKKRLLLTAVKGHILHFKIYTIIPFRHRWRNKIKIPSDNPVNQFDIIPLHMGPSLFSKHNELVPEISQWLTSSTINALNLS